MSFTMDFLFQTILDYSAKEQAIDTVLRILVEDIEQKKKKSILIFTSLEALKTTTGDDNLGLRI